MGEATYGHKAGPVRLGYRYGPSRAAYYPVAPGEVIMCGDILAWAGGGFVWRAGAGSYPCGVSYDDAAPQPHDGAVSVLVEVSDQAVFAYPPATGGVGRSLVGKLMGIGGAQGIETRCAATCVVRCEDVDPDSGLLYVRFDFNRSFTPVA